HLCAGVLRVAPQRRGQERVARQASVPSVVNEPLKVEVFGSAVVLANPGQRQFRSKTRLLVVDTPRVTGFVQVLEDGTRACEPVSIALGLVDEFICVVLIAAIAT